MPGQRGVRSSPPAPTPSAVPTPVHPLQHFSPAPGPAKTGLPKARGSREAGRMQVKSELAVAVPTGPAARAQGARDSAAGARCRCGGSCCSCGCGWAGGSGHAALEAALRGPGGKEQPPGLREATRCTPLPLPGFLASSPRPSRGPGQKQGRKRGSPAVRAALAPDPAPGSSVPVPPSSERPDQLRVQRTSFLLETGTDSSD